MATVSHATPMRGRRFERWTVLTRAGHIGNAAAWECLCDCGTRRVVCGSSLRKGQSTSCGCLRRQHFEGRRFGRLVVEAKAASVRGRAGWRCRCDCGQTLVVCGDDLRGGGTRSCGCLHHESVTHNGLLTRHGHARGRRTPEYRSWRGMMQRCYDQHCRAYKWYGARGISVCARWHRFEAFLEDMGSRPDGLTLDRIDNDGNYEPGNCRWVTMKEQLRNRRPRREWATA